MYPGRDLEDLDLRKRILLGSIARNRWQCREAAIQLARPIDWVDGMLAKWHAISPFFKAAALPMGFMLKKSLFPRFKIVSTLFKLAPVAFTIFRSFRARRA